MNPKMVTITEGEYEILLRRSHKLSCLEAFGVDNWRGYDDAMSMFLEDEEEED
ncbi:hypothetical protein M5X17_27695 [Paenibacillus alvei]|uniref:hypothetical protein n=1 Tax=Paenibacillus alvei TaxID=44250 RepID=UPI002282BC78|nr:hypothetical protein [Paenibacillus alvei]MCY9737490.1 hypothetical protein [Paenibacillus alvei]